MFHSARLKLTGWYVLLVMLVSLSFSLFLYKGATAEIDRFERTQRFRFERKLQETTTIILPNGQVQEFTPLPVNLELLEETHNRIVYFLLSVNIGIFLASTAAAYFLAGITLAPIQTMMLSQKRFIGDASHELRTPLTSLKTAFEVFLRDKSATHTDAKQLVQDSLGEIDRIANLTTSLLELAREENPTEKTKPQVVALHTLLEKVVKNMNPIALKKQIALSLESDDLKTFGDPEELQKLFSILLDNALKYTNQGGTIAISTNQVGRHIKIAVQDSGVGIEEKDLPHIFERFYRADSARARAETGGFGLGLSIAHKITLTHKGTISAKSSPSGSIFTVTLPAARS